jgi:hypothetical protein
MKKIIFFMVLSFVASAQANLCEFLLQNDSASAILVTQSDYGETVPRQTKQDGTIIIQQGETKKVKPQYIYVAELGVWRSEQVKNKQPWGQLEGAAAVPIFKKRFVVLPTSTCLQLQATVQFSQLMKTRGLNIIDMTPNRY